MRRHLQNPWRRPLAPHNEQGFAQVNRLIRSRGRPVVLDSGCGTGRSTERLSRQHPDALCVGIDRSARRLARCGVRAGINVTVHGRVIVARGDCEDWWRLIADAKWPVTRHCLYYPNPYPKATQLKRRWHAHPVFPDLLRMGGEIDLRSDWRIYAEEFNLALQLAGWRSALCLWEATDPVSEFERKYAQRGRELWRVTGSMSIRQ